MVNDMLGGPRKVQGSEKMMAAVAPDDRMVVLEAFHSRGSLHFFEGLAAKERCEPEAIGERVLLVAKVPVQDVMAEPLHLPQDANEPEAHLSGIQVCSKVEVAGHHSHQAALARRVVRAMEGRSVCR